MSNGYSVRRPYGTLGPFQAQTRNLGMRVQPEPSEDLREPTIHDCSRPSVSCRMPLRSLAVILLIVSLAACSSGTKSSSSHQATTTTTTTTTTGPGTAVGSDDCINVQALVHTARTVDGPDLDAEFEHYLGNLVDDISEAQDNNNPSVANMLTTLQNDVEAAANAGSKGGDVKVAVARLVRDTHAAGC